MGRILEVMTTSRRTPRRTFASSPFRPEPERVVEQYEPGDMVSHDIHGMGTVVAVDAHAATVNFGSQTLRVNSPFAKMEKL
jgi:hypothetical protein